MIRFDQWMETQLTRYYQSAQPGKRGDFYTSISVGRTFGELIAIQFAEMWSALGQPERFDIVEQGGHDGRFAVDVFLRLRESFPECFQASRFLWIEPMEKLRVKQSEIIGGFRDKVCWVSGLEELASGSLQGVFFSNELVDSFPVRRVRFERGRWQEGFVNSDALGRGQWEWSQAETALEPFLAKLPALEGYTTEVCPLAADWMANVARVMERGFVLTVDYGDLEETRYHPAKGEGTLRGFHRHRQARDVFEKPGEQDITADVDFSLLIREGQTVGLKCLGFTDQHHALIGLAEKLPLADTQTLRQLKTLLHPEIMGRRFKFLFQSKNVSQEPGLSGLKYAKRDGVRGEFVQNYEYDRH